MLASSFPARLHLLREFLHQRLVLRPIRDIHILLRIVLMVIQLAGRLGAVAVEPAGQAIAIRPHGVAHDAAAARVLAERGFLPGPLRRIEQRRKAGALQVGRQRQPGQLAEGRVDIHELHQRLRMTSGGLLAGGTADQRRVRVVLEVGVLAPRPVLAQLPAVVAPQHNHRLLAQAQPVELLQDAPELGIHVADAGIVAVLERRAPAPP